MMPDLFGSPPKGFPPLRDCQIQSLHLLREGVRNGHRRQILNLSTGAGKTLTALNIVQEAVKKGKRAVFLCDRIALIDQTSARADEYGIHHGVIQATHWRRNRELFQIASLQTISARKYGTDCDLLIVDECHSMYTAWTEWAMRTEAAVIGLTATPFTVGLGKIFTNVVNPATMNDLTRDGVLVPPRILTCVKPDMAGAETSGGEWTARAAAERELTIVGDVVGEWGKHANNAKTIAFGADIAYANELAQRFNGAGINAAVYTSETGQAEREEILREFAKPDSQIRVLCSVAALSKGFDQPDVGCVIDARPLRKSLSEYIQMIGRGLRSSPGKAECLILDHSGNALRFHDDFVDFYFNGCGSLSSAEKQDQKVRKEPEEEFATVGCPQCQRKPFRRKCLACGFEKVSKSVQDETAGVMKEIRIGKSKKVAAESGQDLWAQLCTYARQNLKSDKKSGWAWHKFREITGQDLPRGFPHFDATPDVQITSALASHLHYSKIKYWKGQAKVKSQGVAA